MCPFQTVKDVEYTPKIALLVKFSFWQYIETTTWNYIRDALRTNYNHPVWSCIKTKYGTITIQGIIWVSIPVMYVYYKPGFSLTRLYSKCLSAAAGRFSNTSSELSFCNVTDFSHFYFISCMTVTVSLFAHFARITPMKMEKWTT